MEIRDQLNRKIRLDGIPQRIISLVPSQTELLVDLGLEENIVGITRFCVHPSHLKKSKKIVGGTKMVKPEKIAKLQPDIILCNKEENTPEMVAELEKQAPVHVSNIVEIEDTLELMRQYGKIFEKQALAETIASSVKKKLSRLREELNEIPRLRVAYLIWKEPLMVAGGKTFINTLLKLNKLKNVFEETARYPEITLEELKNKKVELILLSSEPYPFKEEHKEHFTGLGAAVKTVDGEYFSWYGSRLLGAVDYFKDFRKSL